MTDSRPLPELTEGLLDESTVAALVRDLTSETQILEVQTKGGEFERARRQQMPLHEAVQALQAGTVRGVQVRYAWNNEQWLDTLFRHPSGLKLVRIQVEVQAKD